MPTQPNVRPLPAPAQRQLVGAPGESAREHVANALQILQLPAGPLGPDDRAAIAARLRAALAELDGRAPGRGA